MGTYKRLTEDPNPTRNVKICQSCNRIWERWCYGAQSGIEFYSDFPSRGIANKRCIYCIKEIKNAIQIDVNYYKPQYRYK